MKSKLLCLTLIIACTSSALACLENIGTAQVDCLPTADGSESVATLENRNGALVDRLPEVPDESPAGVCTQRLVLKKARGIFLIIENVDKLSPEDQASLRYSLYVENTGDMYDEASRAEIEKVHQQLIADGVCKN